MTYSRAVFLASMIIPAAVLLSLLFYFIPLMGHDYALGVSWAHDYHFAWNKFKVFNIIFTPQRCQGVPVWSNPIGVNFSLYHLLSIFFKDIYVIVLYVFIISTLSFWGTRRFLNLFGGQEPLKVFLALSWCLQGFITSRAVVGHLSFIKIGLWPLYAYLLLNKNGTARKGFFNLCIFCFLYAHDFYVGNIYLFVMFPISFCLLLVVMKINRADLNFQFSLQRLILGCFFSGIIITPKVISIFTFVRNFQREVSFVPIEISKALQFVITSLLVPLPIDFKKMTGWWYGNWESISYLFPFIFPVILSSSIFDFKNQKRILVSFFLLLAVAVFIASGFFSEFIKNIPVLKSFHVNPRWMPIISLGLFFIGISYFKKNELRPWSIVPLILLTLLTPFFFMDRSYFRINYRYRKGLNVEQNRLSYCYEPVFGYRLELKPVLPPKSKFLDPRCYISKQKCQDTSLPLDLYQKLENYSLKPFDEK